MRAKRHQTSMKMISLPGSDGHCCVVLPVPRRLSHPLSSARGVACPRAVAVKEKQGHVHIPTLTTSAQTTRDPTQDPRLLRYPPILQCCSLATNPINLFSLTRRWNHPILRTLCQHLLHRIPGWGLDAQLPTNHWTRCLVIWREREATWKRHVQTLSLSQPQEIFLRIFLFYTYTLSRFWLTVIHPSISTSEYKQTAKSQGKRRKPTRSRREGREGKGGEATQQKHKQRRDPKPKKTSGSKKYDQQSRKMGQVLWCRKSCLCSVMEHLARASSLPL